MAPPTRDRGLKQKPKAQAGRPASPGPGARPAASARPRSRPGRLVVVTLAVVAMAGAAFLLTRRPNPPNAPSAHPFASPIEVHRQGQDATNRGELLEAYEILKRGVEQFPDHADVAVMFGVTANNMSYYVRPTRGRAAPVIPNSLERVRAAQEALAAFDRATASKPRLASPFHYRGNLYAAWGLPDDALRQLYEARMRGDTTATLMRTASAIVAIQRAGLDAPAALEILP